MGLLNISVALFVAKMYVKQFVAQIYLLVCNCIQENYHRCHKFQKVGGVTQPLIFNQK